MSSGGLKIVVIGAGYVGLVNAACLAHLGHNVVGIDRDPNRIRDLNEGRIPIHEPGLSDLVNQTRGAGRLTFTSDLERPLYGSDIILIAVGTPPDEIDGSTDLSQLQRAIKDIAPFCRTQTVVVRSTVPPGTCQKMESLAQRVNPSASISIVSCPEFLREGAAVLDFLKPDRIIVGLDSASDRAVMDQLFHSFSIDGVSILYTTRETSELIKYAANSFLAMKVAFINEMADICDGVGADVRDLAIGIGQDPRIGSAFLKPGPGFGGSCFPKDTAAFARVAEESGAPSKLIEAMIVSNNQRIRAMARRIIAACGGDVDGKRVAFLGLTFKPDTDDVRDSPALAIASRLLSKGAVVVGYDPQGSHNAMTRVPKLEIAATPIEAARGADAIVVATDWHEFSDLDLDELESKVCTPLIIDLRNIVDVNRATLAGFKVISLGIGSVNSNSTALLAIKTVGPKVDVSKRQVATSKGQVAVQTDDPWQHGGKWGVKREGAR